MFICILTLPARGGWVEERSDGVTVIHVKVERLPEPQFTDTYTRSELAGINEFVRRFPDIFAEKYRDKYERDPGRYGRRNWERVEVELHPLSKLEIEKAIRVETALFAIAGGIAPDVMYVNFRMSDTYIQQGFLYPLDKDEDGYLTGMTREELDFRIHPKIWPVIRRKSPGGEVGVWAVPYGDALGKVVLYRKDLFEQAGVPYPHNDWTWDDMLAACKKLTDPGRGVYGFFAHRGKHESWFWINFLWSAGGEALEFNEEQDRWEAVFDSREAAVALEFYTRLCTEPWTDAQGKLRRGYTAKDASDWYEKWERGEIGIMFGYFERKLFQQLNPDVTGMAPLPFGPTGVRAGELNSRMMGLFAGIEQAAVRDAAWEFIRWYDCEDAMGIKIKLMVEGGLGRFVNPVLLEKFGYPEQIRLAPKGWAECYRIGIETGRPEPYGTNCNYAYDILTYPIQDAEQLALEDKLPADREARLDVMQGLLADAVRKANVLMLGQLEPRERLHRRITAALALLAIVVAFVWMFRKVAKVFTPPLAKGERRGVWEFRKYRWAYVMLLPAVLLIFLWQYVPLARGSVMAFQDYRLMGGSRWVWLDNFGDVLWSGMWWAAVWNALRYSFLVMALTFLPPVALAILLQEVPRGKILFRTLFYLPAVITGLVVIFLWKSFYDPSEDGALNALLLKIPAIGFIALGGLLCGLALTFTRRLFQHSLYLPAALFALVGVALFYTCCMPLKPIVAQALRDAPFSQGAGAALWGLLKALFVGGLPEPYRWLSDEDTAMVGCVIPMVWAGMGPGCLIYLAALKGIADDYYEAADIDGATFIDKILFIVAPILRPLIVINFVGVFIASWYNASANILAMTGGGAGTEVAGLHIFYQAFIFLKFGPATSMAWLLGFMLVGFTVYQLRILSNLEFRATGSEE